MLIVVWNFEVSGILYNFFPFLQTLFLWFLAFLSHELIWINLSKGHRAYGIQPRVVMVQSFQDLYRYPTTYHNLFHYAFKTLKLLGENPLSKEEIPLYIMWNYEIVQIEITQQILFPWRKSLIHIIKILSIFQFTINISYCHHQLK